MAPPAADGEGSGIPGAMSGGAGFAITVEDGEVEPARAEMAARDGVHLCPEGAATLVAYRKALAERRIRPEDRCVLFNCADGRKYPLPDAGTALDRHGPINYAAL